MPAFALIPKLMGTCELGGQAPYDDACTQNDIALFRTMDPCVWTCKEGNFEACAATTTQDECLCQDGETTEPGTLITGGYIGFINPSGGKTFAEMAAITSPRHPHYYVYLYATNDPELIECPKSPEGWTQIDIGAGTAGVMDLAPAPITRTDLGCTGGPIELSTEQLNITLLDGVKCLQAGGYAHFMMMILDGNGQSAAVGLVPHLLALCAFPGITPAPQCDRQKCCDWGLTSTSSFGDGRVELTYTRPTDCVCVPVASVTIDDGVNTPEVHPLLVSPAIIGYNNPDFTPGMVVTFTLAQAYEDCEEDCEDPSPSETNVTL